MRIAYQKEKDFNMLAVMRRAGYNHFIDPNTQEESFVLRTGPDFYPRFHVYVHEDAHTVSIDLHLDQKKPQYKGARAHNGEYDGPTVERELARLAGWMHSVYHVFPVRADALEVHFRPQKDIGVQQNNESPNSDKPLFGGIF